MRVSILGSVLATGVWLAAVGATAQTVQLPTFSSASVGTTVVVPDRGAAYLGGVNSAAEGRSEFGVPILGNVPYLGRLGRNVGIGQDTRASSMWVTATIHDFDAMDQALLNTPSPDGFTSTYGNSRGLSQTPAAIAQRAERNAANLAGSWRAQPVAPDLVSDVAAEQASRANRQAARADEAGSFFARGQQAEADGKPNVAKIYYQMAARRATGDLKQLVQARLEAVSGRTTALARNTP